MHWNDQSTPDWSFFNCRILRDYTFQVHFPMTARARILFFFSFEDLKFSYLSITLGTGLLRKTSAFWRLMIIKQHQQTTKTKTNKNPNQNKTGNPGCKTDAGIIVSLHPCWFAKKLKSSYLSSFDSEWN